MAPREKSKVKSFLVDHYNHVCFNFSDKDMEKAKQTFMLSCAGYCVATYVLVSLSVCVCVVICSVVTGYW